MDNKGYWFEFISGVISRVYENVTIDIKRSWGYNDGIRFALYKEIEQKLYSRVIEELIK